MRYLPHTQEEIAEMLAVVGAESLDDLFAPVPESCRRRSELDLPAALTEWELDRHMETLAASMGTWPQHKVFIGAGRYDHYIPTVVPYLTGRGEFVTSYTPYQPEVSQGTLQAIYEYQTLAARLMGVDIATASHYDGATALAEALLMAVRKTGRNTVAVSSAIHPHFRQVVRTYFEPTGYPVIELGIAADGTTDLSLLDHMAEPAGVALQTPNFLGVVENLAPVATAVKAMGAVLVSGFTEPLAFGLLHSPGSQGADIVAGEGQSLGLPAAFGGPGLGMLGCRKTFMRSLPGRLIGRTRDIEGRRGFVLTLATREQHIRRERATSNICSNNSLCAVTAAVYMATLGASGFRKLAALNRDKAEYLKGRLQAAGFEIPFEAPTFNEFVVRFPEGFKERHRQLAEQGTVAGLPLAPYYPALAGCYLLGVTEKMTREDMDALVREVKS